mmetsp:Transcript_46057/g.119127  ORF Transcript_46057/g.119127 Transcript_46057/m.119127 type:complete len:327 (-) Transcript_46057:626-1606(-)
MFWEGLQWTECSLSHAFLSLHDSCCWRSHLPISPCVLAWLRLRQAGRPQLPGQHRLDDLQLLLAVEHGEVEVEALVQLDHGLQPPRQELQLDGHLVDVGLVDKLADLGPNVEPAAVAVLPLPLALLRRLPHLILDALRVVHLAVLHVRARGRQEAVALKTGVADRDDVLPSLPLVLGVEGLDHFGDGLPLDEAPEPLQLLVGRELPLVVVLRATPHHLLLRMYDLDALGLQHLPGGWVEMSARHVHPPGRCERHHDDVRQFAGPLQDLHGALLARRQLGLDTLHRAPVQALAVQRQLPVQLQVLLDECGREEGVVPIEDHNRLLLP